MPSIFKKKNRRRHTASNAEETRQAVSEARKDISKEKTHAQPGSDLVANHSRAKDQDHLRRAEFHLGSEDSTSNASSQANGYVSNTSSMPRSRSEMSSVSDKGGGNKMARKSSAISLHADILFLRWKGEVKRAPIPSPLTMTTLKSLFVAMFEVDMAVKNNPHWVVFMQDSRSEEWVPVMSPNSIPSRSLITIQHCDTPPTPPPGELASSKLSSSNPAFVGDTSHALSRRPSSRLRRGASLQRIQSGVPTENGHTSSDEVSAPADSIEHVYKDVVNRVSSPEQRLIELEASILQENLDTAWAMQCSIDPDDKSLRGRTAALQHGVHVLRRDMQRLRVEQQNQLQLFQHNLRQSCSIILGKLRLHQELRGVAHLEEAGFRRKRLELVPEEEAYMELSSQLYEEFHMLEAWVEELRVDVARRGCKVVPSEIHVLSDSVAALARGLLDLRKRHGPLVERMKSVMEKELEVIVREERFVSEEETRVASSIERCEKMERTLLNLRKVASIQHHRSPSIPLVLTYTEPDRQALLDSIQSVVPDHARRVQKIQMSEDARVRKRDLLKPKGPKLVDQILQSQSKLLKKTDYTEKVETERQALIRSWYIEEKREKELAEWKRKEEERRAEEEKRTREQFLLEQKRREEVEKKKFDDECRRFNERRMQRERMLEELRIKESEWQAKESQRVSIKQLSEHERLQEWRRMDQIRIQNEQLNKPRTGSQSSSDNSAPTPFPPPNGGPPPYSDPAQLRTNPEGMFNMLMMPVGPEPTPGPKRAVTLNVVQQPMAPPSSHMKAVHYRSKSSDRERERKERAAYGHTTAMKALHLENQSKPLPPPAAAAGQPSNGYSWLPQSKTPRSQVEGSYYSEQQIEPVKRTRHLSNPRRRDRSDPRRLSSGAELVSQSKENGIVGGLVSSAAAMARSTDVKRLPMTTGVPPPHQHVPHVNVVARQPQPPVMVTIAPPGNRTVGQPNGGPPLDASHYSSFV